MATAEPTEITGYNVKKAYVGSKLVWEDAGSSPSTALTGTVDFTDGTWSDPLFKSKFSVSGMSFSTDHIYGTGNAKMLLTNNGSKYNKVTIEMKHYIPTGWQANDAGISSSTSTGSPTLYVRTQDYSSASYRPKTLIWNPSSTQYNILSTESYASGTHTLKYEYDWSTGKCAIYLDGTSISTGTDSSYKSSIASSFSSNIFLFLACESSGSYIYSAKYTLE